MARRKGRLLCIRRLRSEAKVAELASAAFAATAFPFHPALAAANAATIF